MLEKTVHYEKCGWQVKPSVVLASNLKKTWKYELPGPGIALGYESTKIVLIFLQLL